MQFGKTDKERAEIEYTKRYNRRAFKRDWVRWFAWKPIRLHNGRWAWLETVEYIDYYYPSVRLSSRYTYGIKVDGSHESIIFRSMH